jgi:hypothetical protein
MSILATLCALMCAALTACAFGSVGQRLGHGIKGHGISVIDPSRTDPNRLDAGCNGIEKEVAPAAEAGGRNRAMDYSRPRFLNDSSIFLSTCRRTPSTLKLAGRWLGG